MNESPSEIVTDLVDLTEIDLERIGSIPSQQTEKESAGSALENSLRRIFREARSPASTIAGFQSAL